MCVPVPSPSSQQHPNRDRATARHGRRQCCWQAMKRRRSMTPSTYATRTRALVLQCLAGFGLPSRRSAIMAPSGIVSCNFVDVAWWRPASPGKVLVPPNWCVLWSVRPCHRQNETIFSSARLNAALIGAVSRALTFSCASSDPTGTRPPVCADHPPAAGWRTDLNV